MARSAFVSMASKFKPSLQVAHEIGLIFPIPRATQTGGTGKSGGGENLGHCELDRQVPLKN